MKPLCVLIYPKTSELEFANPDVPYSILFLGSYLQANGMGVKLFDQRVFSNKAIIKYIESEPVTHVGFSVMTGPQIIFAMQLSKKIKQIKHGVKIIWGGIHITVNPGSVLKQDFIDYAVCGEGEETLLELLQTTDDRHIKGALRSNENLNNLEPRELMDMEKISLEWSLLDPQKYISIRDGRRSIAFITSRGCPFQCQFCYNSIIRNRWRSWSMEKVRYELEKILAFDISYVYFMDDNIATNIKRFAQLCDIFKEKDIRCHADLRATLITNENMDKFHNCSMVFVGAESGSQRILDYLKKGIKVEDIYSAARVLHKRGVNASFSWIIGFPPETKEDIKATVKAVQKVASIMPEAAQRIKIFTPYPGSQVFKEAVQKGYRPPETLEEWGSYTREYCALPYITNPWWYKTISYITFFIFFSGKQISNKLIFQPVIAVFKLLSLLRWHTRFFHFPLEFMLIEQFRKIRRLLSRYI